MSFDITIDYPAEKMEASRHPGTPLETFAMIMQACEAFGLGDGRLPRVAA